MRNKWPGTHRVWGMPSDTFLCGPEVVQQRYCPADCSSPHQSPSEARENWLTVGWTEVLPQRVPSRHHHPASCQAGGRRTPRFLWGPWSIMPPGSHGQRHFPQASGKKLHWVHLPLLPLQSQFKESLLTKDLITEIWGVGGTGNHGGYCEDPLK